MLSPSDSQQDPTVADEAFSLENVRVQLGELVILNGVTCRASRGEQVALLGANGCGKTTLCRLLTGHAFAAFGQVRLLGQTLGQADIRSLRRRVAVVAAGLDHATAHVAGAVVDAELNAIEAVCTGFFGSVGLYDRPTSGQRETAVVWLERVGLSHRFDHRVGTLSAGEQRRLVLARALVNDPELLILDEPTTGLDIAGREQMLATLHALRQTPNPPTLLMVTHHVEELPPDTDRVLLMRRGQITFEGKPDDALTPRHLSDVFGCPVFVEKRGRRWWLEVLPEAWLPAHTER
ncbi:MAG: ATP-binding cassette domain-containing protein [Planctomycetota bacterium]